MAEISEIALASYGDALQISTMSRNLIEHGLPGAKYTEEAVRAAISHESKNVAVSKRGERVVGFGIMTYHDVTANLDLLAVLPEYQGTGLSRDIVGWLEKVAASAGIPDIGVQARERNRKAIRFYTTLGYRIVKRTPRVYGREAQVSLAKKLY